MPALETAGRRLRGRFGGRYLYVAECASTQDLLREGDFPDGAVAVADHQTGGRGRSGRSWDDVRGAALLCSVLLRPAPHPSLPSLSLAVAVATAQAVEATTGLAATVKWPNDVLLEGGKVAGILLEVDQDAVLIGIGVNVNQRLEELPPTMPIPAASLRTATGRCHDRGELLVLLLDRLERAVDRWSADGVEPFLPELERRNALRGRRVRTGRGIGTAGSIAVGGRLTVLLDEEGETLVESGEVVLLD